MVASLLIHRATINVIISRISLRSESSESFQLCELAHSCATARDCSCCSLTMKHKLYCDANYYSSDCSVYCVAKDTDAEGHYTCDPATGRIICRSGMLSARLMTNLLLLVYASQLKLLAYFLRVLKQKSQYSSFVLPCFNTYTTRR